MKSAYDQTCEALVARRKDQNDEDLQVLLEDERFRRFFIRLVDIRCGAAGHDCAVGMGRDGIETALSSFRLAGRRSIGIELRDHAMAVNGDGWMKALEEEVTARRLDEIEKEKAKKEEHRR